MSLMLLTSYDRMLRYLAQSDGTALTDATAQKREITNWIASASAAIERFIDRELHIEARTQYFDAVLDKLEYKIKAPPITTLTSVYEDADAEWDGTGESEITDCSINAYGTAFVLPEAMSYRKAKALRVIYTGGLALSATRSILTFATMAQTFTAANFIQGGTSGALGIVKASSATTATLETLFGVWANGETITEYTDEACATASGRSVAVTALTQTALCETYPDIVRACETQVRYWWKHKHDFELTGTNKDGTNLRRTETNKAHPLEQEALNLLLPYRALL